MRPASSRRPELLRSIERWSLVGMVINGVIGSGIFGLPSRVYALAGVWSIAAFVLCAICVAIFVLCFAEVASRYSATGGPLLYASEAFGETPGFAVGWLVFVARVTAFSANTVLLGTHLAIFFPALGAGPGRAMALTLVVALVAAMNIAGVKAAASASNALAVGKLIPLAVFVVAGLFFIDPARFAHAALPAYAPFAQSVMLLVFGFTGFEMAVIPAGEAQTPARDAPAALLIGMAAVVTSYVLIQIVSIGTLPELASSQRPLADAATRFLGPAGAVMITAGIMVSLAGNLNILVLSASRILYAAAERGQLPAFLATVDPRRRTPVAAVIVTSAVMLGLTLSGTFLSLLTISTVARLVVYAATALTLPALRRNAGAPPAGFTLPAGPVVAGAAVVLCVWLLSNSTVREARDAALAAAAGLGIHFLTRRRVRS